MSDVSDSGSVSPGNAPHSPPAGEAPAGGKGAAIGAAPASGVAGNPAVSGSGTGMGTGGRIDDVQAGAINDAPGLGAASAPHPSLGNGMTVPRNASVAGGDVASRVPHISAPGGKGSTSSDVD